jgi:hypothetical protein
MKYGRPELGERLAADYVLGLMPPRARRRFERAMAHDATLAATTALWSERLGPLDETTAGETPPARVWRAIEQRIAVLAPSPVAAAPPRSFRFSWRGLALSAAAVCAAIAIYVAVDPAPLQHDIMALAGRVGMASWDATAKPPMPDIELSTMRLGVSERERPRWLRATLLATNDALPITDELSRPAR